MDKIFKYGITLFLLISIITANTDIMINKIIETPKNVYQLVLTIILSSCLWGGFLNIIEKSHFIDIFICIFKPVLRLIYGNIINHNDILNNLSINLISNLIGLGTLSTISGIQAFKHMYNIKNKVSSEMIRLVIFNGAGITLFPSSLIMLRKEMNSLNIYQFYPYMLIISISVLIIGLIIQRMIHSE